MRDNSDRASRSRESLGKLFAQQSASAVLTEDIRRQLRSAGICERVAEQVVAHELHEFGSTLLPRHFDLNASGPSVSSLNMFSEPGASGPALACFIYLSGTDERQVIDRIYTALEFRDQGYAANLLRCVMDRQPQVMYSIQHRANDTAMARLCCAVGLNVMGRFNRNGIPYVLRVSTGQ